MRYYKYKKSNSSGKVLAVLLAIAVATLAFFAVVTKGFTVNDPKQWFGKDSEPVEASLTLDTTSVVFKGGTTSAPEVKTINANLITDDADAELMWTLEKVGATGSVSGVTLTPSEDGSSATLVCSTTFTTPLRVKAHVPGTDLLAVATVDCFTRIEGVTASMQHSGDQGDDWGYFTGICIDDSSCVFYVDSSAGTVSEANARFHCEVVFKYNEDFEGDSVLELPETFEYVWMTGEANASAFEFSWLSDDFEELVSKLEPYSSDDVSWTDGVYMLSQNVASKELILEVRLMQTFNGQTSEYVVSSPVYFWSI